MQKMVSFLLVAVMVVATLPHAESIRCYTCAGYNPDVPEDSIGNNKNCANDNFKSSGVQTTTGTLCQTLVEEFQGQEVTVRGPITVAKMTRANTQYLNFKGYFCDTDLCNDKPVSSAPPSRAFSLPLLLLSLLAALPRCLA